MTESLDEFIAEDNAVGVVDAFVNVPDLTEFGSEGTQPAETAAAVIPPTVLLKIRQPWCGLRAPAAKAQASIRLSRVGTFDAGPEFV